MPGETTNDHADLAAMCPPAIPARALNGGLYVGEPFEPGAPWGNTPVVPDVGAMTEHLLAANPDTPRGVRYQYAGAHRPGNNAVRPAWLGYGDGGLPCWGVVPPRPNT